MNFGHTKFFHKNAGFSLISLMVGSVISVGVILIALQFYKNHITVSANLTMNNQHNSQLQFFLNTLQLEMEQAGFGVLKEDITNINEVVSIKNNNGVNDIYWSYDDNGLKCRGFRERHFNDANANNFYVFVSYLEAPDSACQPNIDLTTLDWTLVEDISLFKGPDLENYIATNDWLFEFKLTNTNCSPFGLNIDPNQQRVMLEVSSYTQGVIAGDLTMDQGRIQLNKCLSNIQV